MTFTRHTVPNALRALVRAVRSLFAKDELVIATPGVQSVRELRCLHCPHYVDPQCTKCSCVVALKTLMATESCPIGRWRRQTKNSTGL